MKALWFSLLFGAAAAVAQNPSGRITGQIQDSSNAVVPGAAVHLKNVETAVGTATTSNEQGMFTAGNLIPGHYQLTVDKTGFKTYDRGPLEVRVADVLGVDVVLEVGSISERLTVTADAPLLETVNASLGQVIDKKRIDELPIPNGNVSYLLQLTPGVNTTGSPNAKLMPHNTGASSDAVVLGSRSQTSEFTIDGIPNMSGTLIAFVPNPEMVQEFRVETAPYDASIGHFTGAHINMVMKTGTNQIHGTAFFGYRNQDMMARNYFGANVIPQRVLRGRTSIGGPVVLPGLYNGRNRTFFTYGFDSNLYDTATFGKAVVPTLKERSGDFSELLALGSSYRIYDPSTAQAVAGGRITRSAFPGNIIPGERIDPIARKLLKFFPLPNIANAAADGSFNYNFPSRTRFDNANHMSRIDQVVSQNHRLYASFTRAYSTTNSPGAFNNAATGTIFKPSRVVMALDDVLTPRADLVIELRYGLTRGPFSLLPYSSGFDLGSLGISNAIVQQLDRAFTTIPTLTIAPFTALARPSPGDVEHGCQYGSLSGGHSFAYSRLSQSPHWR